MAFLPISRNKKVDFAEDSYARGQIPTNRNRTVRLCKILLNEKSQWLLIIYENENREMYTWVIK